MIFDNDGDAIDLIIAAGGKINKGLISYDGCDPFVLEAIRYLCMEWDYATN